MNSKESTEQVLPDKKSTINKVLAKSTDYQEHLKYFREAVEIQDKLNARNKSLIRNYEIVLKEVYYQYSLWERGYEVKHDNLLKLNKQLLAIENELQLEMTDDVKGGVNY